MSKNPMNVNMKLVITAITVLLVSVLLSYAIATYVIKKGDTGPQGPKGDTGATGVTGPVPVEVVIYATNPYGVTRTYWGLTFDRSLPTLTSVGYVSADFNEQHSTGDTMTAAWNLTGGLHYLYFAISQSRGASYNTYAGTITINGQTYNFSGLDETNSVIIDFHV
jgi:hypothetical protein